MENNATKRVIHGQIRMGISFIVIGGFISTPCIIVAVLLEWMVIFFTLIGIGMSLFSLFFFGLDIIEYDDETIIYKKSKNSKEIVIRKDDIKQVFKSRFENNNFVIINMDGYLDKSYSLRSYLSECEEKRMKNIVLITITRKKDFLDLFTSHKKLIGEYLN